jgi:hypothetical protein
VPLPSAAATRSGRQRIFDGYFDAALDRARHDNFEAAALAKLRPERYLVAQQARDTIDDRKTQAEATLGALRAVGQAMKLLEHGLLVALGNTDPRVDDLDGNVPVAPSATDQDRSFPRVPARIADEVLQDATQ